MRIVRIGEIAKAKGGKRLPKGMRVQDDPTPYRYLRVVDMGDRSVDRSSIRFITSAAHEATRRYTIASSDVYVSIAGTIGRVGRLPSDLDGIHLTENAAKITEIDPGADPSYLAFYLQSSLGQEQIRARTVGTSQPKLALFRIEEIEISLPPLEVQRAVVSAIGGFDDLIENNRRRIEILEEMARLLYREWFVHFRFPGHENVELVDSELGPIPEGWVVEPTHSVFDAIGGGTPSKKTDEYWAGGDIEWFTPSDLTRSGQMFAFSSGLRITRPGLAKSSAKMFPAGSVMLTSRATIGVIAITTQEATTNQGFITCVPNNRVTTPFLYFWLDSNVDRFLQLAGGATFKELRKSTFRELPLAVPPERLMTEFTTTVSAHLALIANLIEQNRVLRDVRDLLLPRLVSGELDVSELDLDGVLA